MTDFPTKEVREGRASLLVPDVPRLRGPGRRTALPFYNPSMAVSRDVTALVLSAWLPSGATILDGLAGTGVLGIRIGLETERDAHVTWNDKNPAAHDLIVENAARNSVEGEVLGEDLRAVLARRRFTYVDVDPFGSPVPFVDAAVQQAWRGSALGIAATDVAPLAGTYPRTCWRRYGARSVRNPCSPETALRIFLGYLVRVAATHERGLRPLAVFAAEHFLKAIAAVDPRVSAAEACLAQIGYVRFEGARFELSASPPDGPHAGPMWLGPLADVDLLKPVRSRPNAGYRATRVLEGLLEEASLPPLFYENHSLAQALQVDSRSLTAWMNVLRSAGFRSSRTIFSANGVRTDAPWEEVVRLYRSAKERQ